MTGRWTWLIAAFAWVGCAHPAAATGEAALDADDFVDATELSDASDLADADASVDVAEVAGDTSDVDLGPPIRSVLLRPWRATPPNNLLLDSLEDNDNAWGKLVGIDLPTTLSASFSLHPAYTYSDTPLGVSAPSGLVFPPQSNATKITSRKIVAAFSGSSKPVDAGIWLAARDASDQLVTSPEKLGMTVAILPTDASETTAYPLQSDGAAPIKLSTGYWSHYVLPTPVEVPHGGWLIITLPQVAARLWILAPEIVPATAAKAKGKAHGQHATLDDLDAITAYAQRMHDTQPSTTRRRSERLEVRRER